MAAEEEAWAVFCPVSCSGTFSAEVRPMVAIAEAASVATTQEILSEDSAAGIQAVAELPATGETMAHSQQLPNELVQKLQKAHGDRLVSVVLYGSAAAPGAQDRRSDINVLCVLKEVTPDELHAAEPIFRWWREMKNPSPLLLSAEEFRASTDCFPMEFHDIKERHCVLYGDNLITGLEINDRYYRAMVEHELRAKLTASTSEGRLAFCRRAIYCCA